MAIARKVIIFDFDQIAPDPEWLLSHPVATYPARKCVRSAAADKCSQYDELFYRCLSLLYTNTFCPINPQYAGGKANDSKDSFCCPRALSRLNQLSYSAVYTRVSGKNAYQANQNPVVVG